MTPKQALNLIVQVLNAATLKEVAVSGMAQFHANLQQAINLVEQALPVEAEVVPEPEETPEVLNESEAEPKKKK